MLLQKLDIVFLKIDFGLCTNNCVSGLYGTDRLNEAKNNNFALDYAMHGQFVYLKVLAGRI